MKQYRKVLSILLALLMLLSLTACAQNPAETETGGGASVGGTDGVYDFGGATIKIGVWGEAEPMLGNSEYGDAYYYSLKNACEKFNCKVEWVMDTQENHFSTFIQKSLAGEVYADIITCHSWNYVSLIDQGMILPTDEYIANSADPEMWEQNLFVLNGKNWGLEPVRTQNYTPALFLLINTKMLDALGLEHPQALARRGEWTWDKFREYCAAATDPLNETYGVGCFSLNAILKSGNNFDYAVQDENGYWHNGFTYEKTKVQGLEMLELVQKMALEDKSILGVWTDSQGALDDTLNAFKDGKLLFAFNPTVASLKKSGFEDYSVVTIPQGPSSTGLTETLDAFAFWAIPRETNFPPEALAAFWMEVQRTWDPADEDGYYEADEDEIIDELWDKKWMTREDAQFMLEMGKTVKVQPAGSVTWGALIAETIFGGVLRGEVTPAAVIEQTDGEMQSLIDATYNKK